MVYLASTDYAAYGLAAGTSTDVLVMKASALIDNYCHRLSIGVTLYDERIDMPEDRSLTRLSFTPFVAWDTTDSTNPTGLQGRYSYGRRGSGSSVMYEAASLLQLSSAFGGPPAWNVVSTALADVQANTGALWVPIGIYQEAYSEIHARYTAGYAVIPDAVKLATALLVGILANRVPNTKTVKAGDRTLQFFGSSVIDGDLAMMLDPYRAKALR
jgi:hypothetical protein